MGKAGMRFRVLIWSSLLAFFLIRPASANTVAEMNDFTLESFLPMIIAFAIAIPVWKWFIPNQ